MTRPTDSIPRPRRWLLAGAVLAMAGLLATACASSDDDEAADGADEIVLDEVTDGSGDTGGVEASRPPSPGAATFGPGDDSALRSTAEAGDGDIAPEPEIEPAEEIGLRAGSVDDNEQWEAYLLYLQEAQAAGIEYSPLYVEGRRIIQVVTPDGAPVLDALIVVVDQDGAEVAQVRTHADGSALFFAPALDGEPIDQQQAAPTYTAVIAKDGVEQQVELGAELVVRVEMDVTPTAAPVLLDVQFLVDATGSMADEIERLKANMISVADQISSLPGEPDVRFALTTYRDRGEEYVTRTVDFTGDVAAFTDELRGVVADGGGDEPEALNEGLQAALDETSWRRDAAVRLVFLVADAPPHLDYDGPDYAPALVQAAAEGVKIFPVASSGANFQAELIFRQMAQYTSGRFVFLTYGADGVTPGDETQFNVDDYSVLSLDELIVKLVDDELAALDGG